MRLDQLAHRLFRLAVGDGDGGAVGLLLDRDLLAEIAADDRARPLGKLAGQRQISG